MQSLCYILFIGGNTMEWISRLNEALSYIEEYLEGEINYDKAAQIACCSTFHFQ